MWSIRKYFPEFFLLYLFIVTMLIVNIWANMASKCSLRIKLRLICSSEKALFKTQWQIGSWGPSANSCGSLWLLFELAISWTWICVLTNCTSGQLSFRALEGLAACQGIYIMWCMFFLLLCDNFGTQYTPKPKLITTHHKFQHFRSNK